MKKLFILIWMMSIGINAQQFKLAGTVKNQEGQVLSKTHVKILEKSEETQTDENGYFEFLLNPGKYTLLITQAGYKNYRSTVDLNKNIYLEIYLLPDSVPLEEVVIYSVNASKDMPVTYTNINKEEIQEQNLGQDIPYLLDFTPAVVTTSDAGAGVGYTGIRIRGISSQQINVTLNGVPLNDPESHGVYWVDIPDFAASTQSIQIQRGVGTSTFGTGAFGAAISLTTDRISKKAYALLQASAGSFNTQKYSAKVSTGLLHDHFEFSGRFSKIRSDGYIDRAWSDMYSYYFSGTYVDKKNTLKAILFGGEEKTYQAWYGVDKQTLEEDPTFNYAGAIYDENWNITDFYDNEIDHYKQDHAQLHFEHKSGENLKFNLTAHYTYGRGYYEQYKQNRDFADYGFTPITINGAVIDQTDLIRRKHLDNDFYGLIGSTTYQAENMRVILGIAANEYDGRHFGKVIWARYASDSEINHEYYRNLGVKKTVSGFAKSIYNISEDLKLFTDIQFRKINYSIDGTIDYNSSFKTDDNLFFVNPKIGLMYEPELNQQYYLSVAQTHREPNRDDYINNPVQKPKAETLNDIEAGWKYRNNKWMVETNLFGMFYKDQLVLTGQIDNVGSPIRKNVGESYRLGVEAQGGYKWNEKWEIMGNIALSRNRNIDYYEIENSVPVSYGDTKLTYSPEIVGAAIISWKPISNFNLKLYSKYVGEQYMDNKNTPESKLDAYFVENALITYNIMDGKDYFDKMSLQLKINNIFDQKYVSNGYMWGSTPYYFPQAGINFLAGINVKF
jgi:iron complex outermembrane receptor protein